jgi:hypothetical protein
MCDTHSTTFNYNDKHENNEETDGYQCSICTIVSYKRLLCDCNTDKAKDYMDANPYSRLALNLVKCYTCSNCWHGYKRCECDKLAKAEDEAEDEDEDELDNFDDFVKCSNCGNIWDGCAQCNCWGLDSYSYYEDTSDTSDTSDTTSTMISN